MKLSRLLFLLIVLPSGLFASVMPDAFWPQARYEYGPFQMTISGNQVQIPGLYNSENGNPVRVLPSHADLETMDLTVVDNPYDLIDLNPSFFHVGSKELEVLQDLVVNGKRYFSANQRIDGRPVLDTRILLRLSSNGSLPMIGADLYPGDATWNSTLSPLIAASDLAGFCGLGDFDIVETKEAWIRDSSDLLPVYFISLSGDAADERPVGLVHAETGEILGFYNEVYYDLPGTLIGPNLPLRYDDDPVYLPYSFATVTFDGDGIEPVVIDTDENGQFNAVTLVEGGEYDFSTQLSGPWVQVSYEDGDDASFTETFTAEATYNPSWLWPEMGRIDEFNVFYHTNFIHSFYKELDPLFTGMDESIPATVAYDNNYENAFWNGEGMFFGAGAGQLRNLALFSDIIYHEYTHGVTGRIYPHGTLPYVGQSGAMNEAWSDYFPCSIHDDSGLSRGVFVGNDNPMRDLNNDRKFPDNWVGEVHGDGMIIGGAMWDVRELLGAVYTDSLIHFARYGLANDFESFLVEVLVADDDDGDISDGTPHDREIYQAFGHHGIGPGLDPNLVVEDLQFVDENEDGFLQQGEWVEVFFEIRNDVFLYPPPATGIVLHAGESEFLNWDRDELAIPVLGPGESLFPEQGLRFQVNEDCPNRFEMFTFQFTANEGSYENSITQLVMLGEPQILIMDDDGENSYQTYYTSMMLDLETGASIQSTSDVQVQPDPEFLARHQVVIWHTGDNESPLSIEQRNRLVDYVNNGGNLILTGQYVSRVLAEDIDFAEFLGVAESIDSVRAHAAVGIEGQPYSEGLTGIIFGAGGASNQVSPSAMIPAEGAEALYSYFYDEGDIAGIIKQHESGGITVYLGFGLEAVTGGANTSQAFQLLQPLLDIMVVEDENSVADLRGDDIPIDFSVSPVYPNPFNPSASLSYTLPEAGRISIRVFNLLGQEVSRPFQGISTPGLHTQMISMNGYSTGIYFVRLESKFGVSTQKILLAR